MRTLYSFPGRTRTLLTFVTLLFTLPLVLLMPVKSAEAAPGDFLFEWGSRYHFFAPNESPTDESIGPHGIDLDAAGNVYVADTGHNRIQVFTSDGRLLKNIGSPGQGPGELYFPLNLALDSDGNLYVADSGNHRIVIFDMEGVHKGTITGFDNGQTLGYPRDIAVDRSGKIYVLDTSGQRPKIYSFSRDGAFLGTVGAAELDYPSGIGLDVYDNLYVAVGGRSRVVVYSKNGTLLRTIGTNGNNVGELTHPREVAVDLKGDIYVADTGKNRVLVFSAAGQFLRNIGYDTQTGYSYGSKDGELFFPKGVAIAQNGTVYVGDSVNARVQLFSEQGIFLAKWATYGPNKGEFYKPHGITVDRGGRVFVADTNNSRIQVFSPSGSYLKEMGSFGEGAGQLWYPLDAAVDKKGNVFVADMVNRRIDVFNGDGDLVNNIPVSATWLTSVAIDKNGKMYLSTNRQLFILNQRGSLVKTFGTNLPYSEAHYWLGLTIDRKGRVYVADAANNTIAVFSCDGDFLRNIGSYGSGDGELNWPSDVAVDFDGNVYVADTYNDRIQVFNNDGTFLGKWGSIGQGPGEFGSPDESESQGPLGGPYGLAVNTMGTVVYVADTFNHRIQAFAGYGASHFNVSAPSTAVAGSPIKFTVTALDDADNKVLGYNGTVHFTSSDTSAVVPADAALKNGAGTFSIILKSPGKQSVRATDTTVKSLTGTSNAVSVTSTAKSPGNVRTKPY